MASQSASHYTSQSYNSSKKVHKGISPVKLSPVKILVSIFKDS